MNAIVLVLNWIHGIIKFVAGMPYQIKCPFMFIITKGNATVMVLNWIHGISRRSALPDKMSFHVHYLKFFMCYITK